MVYCSKYQPALGLPQFFITRCSVFGTAVLCGVNTGGVSYQAGLFEGVPAGLDRALQERSVRHI